MSLLTLFLLLKKFSVLLITLKYNLKRTFRSKYESVCNKLIGCLTLKRLITSKPLPDRRHSAWVLHLIVT